MHRLCGQLQVSCFSVLIDSNSPLNQIDLDRIRELQYLSPNCDTTYEPITVISVELNPFSLIGGNNFEQLFAAEIAKVSE